MTGATPPRREQCEACRYDVPDGADPTSASLAPGAHVDDQHLALGTVAWVQQTSGWLTPAERRSLLLPLLRTHVRIGLGRLAMVTRLNHGRHAFIPTARLAPPSSVLTRTAEERARAMLAPVLINHSYRTYMFGRALAVLDDIDVDDELLFAASMLHDTGLVNPTGDADFTLASARVAREVAEQVGLSGAASTTMQNAITLHHSPGVSLTSGAVAYLLSAGAALDVVGLRSWDLPTTTLSAAVTAHPRENFKQVFGAAFAQEAARVPHGRTRFLHRYGAFGAAVRLSPFDS
ncbi:HD domain-containing protein [Nocardioides sp. CN2-186]|uniref:HD domain-containing protein n=1 Tax=Nocardioides tweenelious TaxID=3156607 RepID=UPI0032B53730